MRKHFMYPFLFLFLLSMVATNAAGQDGETLFNQNCAACHKLGAKLIGPDLIGVSERRSEDWLMQFIKSSQQMIKAGDADAVAVFEEYNQLVMTDQAHLGDDKIKAIITYIDSKSTVKEEVAENEEPATPVIIEYSEEDILIGRNLFSGTKRFKAEGPSCISCHHVNDNELISGGALAKDLTHVYGRMGDAGIAGILGAPPFPAMSVAYGEHPLDSTEIAQLTAYFKNAEKVSEDQVSKSGIRLFMFGGGAGLIILFLLIAWHWNSRMRKPVKHNIFTRQIKSK